MMMKILSFYLPQFHEIPENNDAWENGFTEWTNVKKAEKYYDWQQQPRVPLEENYYNLLDIEVLKWQADLAKEAGIYGFCYYHYWFNGRMVLEKPIAMLLEHKEINQNFCFAWANESWTKTWHGAGGNKEILISQTYGGENEWKAHYEYFRKYFVDERYIKENNKPVLIIYRLKNIPEFNQMIKYWDACCKKDGFGGIYIISMNTGDDHAYMSYWVDGWVDFEPNKTKYEVLSDVQLVPGDKPIVFDYRVMCQKMLETLHEKNHFRTVFVDYDDTPRRKEKGICTQNKSVEIFKNTLEMSIQLAKEEGNEYIFINAWNEWGEGNYLEPDECNEYAYLEAVKDCARKGD